MTMDELAAKAGRLLRGEDAYTRATSEPRVKESKRRSSSGISASFTLRVAVSRKNKKPTEVISNASESALQNGAAEYDNQTYASRLAAERDAPRFRLWVELLYPPMKGLVAAMTREDRALLHSARTISAMNEQRNQAFMQTLKASGAKKRRRRRKSAEMYDARAAELEGKMKRLEEDLREIEEAARGGAERGEDLSHASARQLHKLQRQHELVHRFFGKLAKRNRVLSEKCREWDARVGALLTQNVTGGAGEDAHVEENAETAGTDADDDAELYEDYAADDDLLEQLTRGLEVHAVADAVAVESLSPKICGRTLLIWAREYLDDGMFEIDMRGVWKPEHLLDDEDVLERVRRFMREKAKSYGEEGLSKERMLKFINDELLPAMMEEEDEDGGGKRFASIITRTMTPREDGTYKISLETARLWMHRAGAERGYFRNDKFTDVHEREDVVADRIQYLKKVRPPRAFSGHSQLLPSRFARFLSRSKARSRARPAVAELLDEK